MSPLARSRRTAVDADQANGGAPLQARVWHLEDLLARQSEELALCRHQLTLIYSSDAYRDVARLHRLWNRLLPPGSRRRNWIGRLARKVRILAVRIHKSIPQRPVSSDESNYADWLRQTEPDDMALEQQRQTRFPYQPQISVLIGAAGAAADQLRDTARSVAAQTYSNWQLVIVCGGEPPLESAADARWRTVRAAPDASTAMQWNAALAAASGDYVTWLEPSDELSPAAFFEIVLALNETPADVIYTDEDQVGDGGRCAPRFKPDWSPDLLRCTPYLGRLLVVRGDLMQRLGGFRDRFADAAEYDLSLRASESADAIAHIPQVLYHRGRHTDAPLFPESRHLPLSRQALQEHLLRRRVDAEIHDGLAQNTWQVRYQQTQRPLVSIIIPNRDEADSLARCVTSLRSSTYGQVEVLIVENGSRNRQTFELYAQLTGDPRVRVLEWNKPFNYSGVNNWAATQARGEVLLLLNNDTEVINPDWLERMLEHTLRPEVGAVGAKLYFSDGTIQHGGVIVGIGPVAGHAHRFAAGDSPGYANRLATVQNLSAVTAACLMVRREVFQAVGGLDEEFPLALNDVDFCLRLRKAGYQIVWTPFAELYHHESKTRGRDDTAEKQARALHELTHFYRRWHEVLLTGDPFYNPNFTNSLEDFSLRIPDSAAQRAA